MRYLWSLYDDLGSNSLLIAASSRVPRVKIFQSVRKWFTAGSRRYYYELLRARKGRNEVTEEKAAE